MVIYNGIYTGKFLDNNRNNFIYPEDKNIHSCKLIVIKRASNDPRVSFIKPVIVIASDITKGPKRKICAENLGKQVFREFNLPIDKTLWVECDPAVKKKAVVASFKPKYFDGNEMIYYIEWRGIMDSEIRVIKNYISDFPY